MWVLIQELRGEALVWAAARAAAPSLLAEQHGHGHVFDPLKQPEQAEAIRDVEGMTLERWVPWPSERWWARIRDDQMREISVAWGSTKEEATLRCLVKHRLGTLLAVPVHVMLESAKNSPQASLTVKAVITPEIGPEIEATADLLASMLAAPSVKKRPQP